MKATLLIAGAVAVLSFLVGSQSFAQNASQDAEMAAIAAEVRAFAAQPGHEDYEKLRPSMGQLLISRRATSLQDAYNQAKALQAAKDATLMAEIAAEIRAFASQPGHEDYDALKLSMGQLLQSGRATSLQDAYDQAKTSRAIGQNIQRTSERNECLSFGLKLGSKGFVQCVAAASARDLSNEMIKEQQAAAQAAREAQAAAQAAAQAQAAQATAQESQLRLQQLQAAQFQAQMDAQRRAAASQMIFNAFQNYGRNASPPSLNCTTTYNSTSGILGNTDPQYMQGNTHCQ